MELPLVPSEDHPAGAVRDTGWPSEARAAIGFAVVLLGVSLTVEVGNSSLSPFHALLWSGFSALVFAILLPPRIEAAPGRLTVHGLGRRRTVHTDRLTSVRWCDGVAQRVILCDTTGTRAEIDPRVFVANPPLWHRLEADARTSVARGTLVRGSAELDLLALRLDRETARTVFRISGLG
ncbi:hypothetical protein M5362_00910 [Streptomyces sp. Je 1-79]|uniref:hypothetical protein n=1 Tax=Streptomyces sp. Je 1-79 TaxID=2943847 RepID=UPI0021A820F7|nr:hypothetical protein [Streptomyces sp. Je 1-79]MCT4351692.1 hypothetical protein [Streptomyces sp. Je 1-79]